MGYYVCVKDGKVQNIIVSDPDHAASISADWDAVVCGDSMFPQPAIGWAYEDGAFINPTPCLCVKDNVIVCALPQDPSVAFAQQSKWDGVFCPTGLDPMPQVGWVYSDGVFSPPVLKQKRKK